MGLQLHQFKKDYYKLPFQKRVVMSAVAVYLLLMVVAAYKFYPVYSMEQARTYFPTWESLDSRPLPEWYDKVKFGIFIHWGVFSVPSFGSEWFWWRWQGSKSEATVKFMADNYRPSWTYADFAHQFTAEFYNADEWVEIFKASGAKYVVLTSKHHDGYTMWPSKRSFNWNSMEVGPKRDLVGELADAVHKAKDIHFGLYHSLYEWFNPLYLQDKANGFKTQAFVRDKTMHELYDIVNTYKPEVIWSDGDWEATPEYWNSTNFLAWLYNESPVKDTVVTNDRWGIGSTCHHGGYYTCHDRYNPGKLQKRKWENAMTIDKKSWGFRRNAPFSDYFTINDLIGKLAKTVSCGGNLLMNIGPTLAGRIAPIYEERLRQMGTWLGVNGEAIYESVPWVHQNDSITPNLWYTSKTSGSRTTVYAIVLNKWPTPSLVLGSVKAYTQSQVSLLGYAGEISQMPGAGGGMSIDVSKIPATMIPCDWAWVLKLEGVMAV